MSETEMILETVDAFCRQYLSPAEVQRRDAEHVPPYDLLPALADLGLIRAHFGPEHDGIGLPWSQVCLIQERLSYHAYFASSILNRILCFGIMPLMHFGTDEQKSSLLPRLFDGKLLIALALSEPDVGSDARAVRTKATRNGAGGWTINGRKTWISDAGGAGYLLALCRTPEEGEGSLTAFLVPADAAGVAMTKLSKVGNNCMPSFDIGFCDVDVDANCVLGTVGKGFDVITRTLGYSRASMSAAAVGCAQAAMDLVKAYAGERLQFGKPIGNFQVIRHRLVDMHMEILKARLVVRELARQIDTGDVSSDIAPVAKITATEALQFVTNHGMQIMASAGYSSECAMQRYWRDARLYSFGEGTNEIQREIIGKYIMRA